MADRIIFAYPEMEAASNKINTASSNYLHSSTASMAG